MLREWARGATELTGASSSFSAHPAKQKQIASVKIIDKILEYFEKEFKIDARGYRPQEVDKFLDMVIRDYAEYNSIIKKLDKDLKDLAEDNSKLKQEVRFLKEQLDAIFEDIFPDSVKIGMVSSSKLIDVIADRLKFYSAKNIVVDPVMVATSGSALIKTDAIKTLVSKLLPLATLVTPNIPEAEILSDMKIAGKEDMIKAAEFIEKSYGCSVLLKGGHSIKDANDLLCENGRIIWFDGKRIDNPNTHGTGCTLSSAIASNLAKGLSLTKSVEKAKEYISKALMAGLDLGNGSGPLMHNFDLKPKYIV